MARAKMVQDILRALGTPITQPKSAFTTSLT
jgi:hypothetical protein